MEYHPGSPHGGLATVYILDVSMFVFLSVFLRQCGNISPSATFPVAVLPVQPGELS